MPGYDPNRFVGLSESEKQEYTCGICLDIFGDPVDTKCCGQTFCRPCIEGALRVNSVCPLDRRPLNIGDLQNTSRVLKNILGKLKIHCDYKENGCTQIIQLDHLANHVKNCQYKPYMPQTSLETGLNFEPSATRLTCLEPNIEQDTLLPITVVSAKSHYRLMSLENKRSLYKCGNGYKTLANIPSWNLYSQHNGIIHNRFVTSAFPYNYIINDKVSVFVGDITALEVDAIVNSANEYLRGGGGVDGAIHAAADPHLLQSECRALNGCPTGSSKITGGYKLPAKYVIHTAGPVGERPPLLQSCYKTALDVMANNQLTSIAFPCISTGLYEYPNEKAAHMALSTVRQWLDNSPAAQHTQRVIFCLFLQIDVDIYHNLMPLYFPLH